MPVLRLITVVARLPIAIGALAMLTACAAPQASGINDPNEERNRKVHAFNVSLDRSIVRPVAVGYSNAMPDEIEDSINNFSENLGEPSRILNAMLQGDLRGAGLSTTRFLTNTVLGFGGLVDAATEFNVPEQDTDFGETLHVWGVGEGPYIESPVFGPSTRRDSVGRVVDLLTNPLSYTLPTPEAYYGTGAGIASRLSSRGRYADTVDSILYDSADSYAQSRLIYLQNRRFELGSDAGGASDDPYSDPYEDPYAQ